MCNLCVVACWRNLLELKMLGGNVDVVVSCEGQTVRMMKQCCGLSATHPVMQAVYPPRIASKIP